MNSEDAEGQRVGADSEIVRAEGEIAEVEKGTSREDQDEKIPFGQVRSMMFSGPLPPPDVLDRYNDTVPNGADRLFSMVEKEQDHRLAMKGKLVECQITDIAAARAQTGRGQVFGLTLGLSIIAAGIVMTYRNHATPGAAVITGTLAAGVSVFVIGRKNSKDNDPQLPAEDSELG